MKLLSNYRQTYDYSRALAKFEETYDEYKLEIQENTAALGIRDGAGVDTFEQANDIFIIYAEVVVATIDMNRCVQKLICYE